MSVSFSEPDQYGQVHPNETEALITAKLQDLEVEIAKIPKDQKEVFEQAKIKCPEQLTPEFKLMFLRCEVFNADLAALRLVKYWEKRLEIFGSDRAFLPLTQNGALKDDALALSFGFFQLTPCKDSSGRSIMFVDPSRQDKTKYERESMARSAWYVFHSALEDVDTQKKGLVVIVYPKKAKFTQLDRGLAKLNMESIKGCIPVRMSAIHLCHPPTFFRIVFPIFRLFMGERLVKRFRLHSGSEESVLGKLASFSVTKDAVPSEIGGNIVLDHTGWLEDRKADGK
mmetsp:Transcript_31568/g.52114  ORF Transcript_31568/g.52114 Transcript_31568/m.52114 type:complete len:284 (-) Transcript_31568:178-1029(-)|eukprot:CAMPEP_0119015314 /NCGR_PEP_ID=MMETSP1176-20130426/10796_1 /TAXON_ID=265551 /ORGANISM="Synedropsis recta cf, Strain CCMP1620" /LENGTH=283 /DNA_ID=CAMNT_0006968593 /DNA_START=75 /DNA_END=926 /DNA_ORIENTATION=+